MKKIFLTMCLCISVNAFSAKASPINMAYVEVNANNFANVGCYVRSDNGKPFFNYASIFAANINGNDPDRPVIFFNSNTDAVLNHTDQVARVQSKGIKVLLSFLGNWQNAGWSCMVDQHAIETFAHSIVQVLKTYHLDGVDIDDEYSSCATNPTSMLKIARAIKNDPDFKGMILTKALYIDDEYFLAKDGEDKLADFLDYGWEMSYGSSDFANRLSPYLQYGMVKSHLGLGINAGSVYPSPSAAASFVKHNGYGGMMVYNVTNNSEDVLSQIANIENAITVTVVPNCIDQ